MQNWGTRTVWVAVPLMLALQPWRASVLREDIRSWDRVCSRVDIRLSERFDQEKNSSFNSFCFDMLECDHVINGHSLGEVRCLFIQESFVFVHPVTNRSRGIHGEAENIPLLHKDVASPVKLSLQSREKEYVKRVKLRLKSLRDHQTSGFQIAIAASQDLIALDIQNAAVPP